MLRVESPDEGLDLASVIFGRYLGPFKTVPQVLVPLPEIIDEGSVLL
jgi:hypothetical protein